MLIEKNPTPLLCNGIFIIIITRHLLCNTLKVWKATLFGFHVQSHTNIIKTLQNFV